MSKWQEKLAQNTPVDGHWRRLEPQQHGKGQGGEEQVGKTWVHHNGLNKDIRLLPHQIDFMQAVDKMDDDAGIIAAHGTGTGKTLSAISSFEELKGEGRAKRALVVTPAGLRSNFLEKGVEKFTDSQGEILSKPKELSEGVEYGIVSYDAFRRRPQEFIDALKPDTIIADEVHRAANPDSKNYKALMSARREVPRFIGLTASVVQNKPDEIVPLLHLTDPDAETYSSKRSFRDAHVERRASKTKGIFGGKTYEEQLIRQTLLKSRVGGNIHYVEDLDASEKPKKVVETIPVLMSDEQLDLYHMSMKGIDPVIVAKIKAGQPVSQDQAMMLFTRLLRARQASNSLNSVIPDMPPEVAAERTPKIKKILDDAQEHLKNTPDGQVIMYTNLVHGGVDVLEAGLKARGIPFGTFAGRGVKGMTEENRQGAVKKYLKGKNRVIVITGAGAEGLSLGNTTMVQMVDGHYNPERIAQAEARGIRAGGQSQRPIEKRKVEVKRYVSTLPKSFWQKLTLQDPDKSVEQWVYRTAEKKTGINRQLRDTLQQRSDFEDKKRDSALFRAYAFLGGQP